MLPDRVSNPEPLTYESGALPIVLRGPVSSSIHVHVHSLNRFQHKLYGVPCQLLIKQTINEYHCINVHVMS